MLVSVLPESAPQQPEGLISAAHQLLFLPAAVAPLVGEAERYDGNMGSDEVVRVVQLDSDVAQTAAGANVFAGAHLQDHGGSERGQAGSASAQLAQSNEQGSSSRSDDQDQPQLQPQIVQRALAAQAVH